MEIREYTEYREDEIRRLYAAVGWTAYLEALPAANHDLGKLMIAFEIAKRI